MKLQTYKTYKRMLQKVSIDLRTSSSSESFRILNIYKYNGRLIVVSKHSYPIGGFGVATCGYFNREVEIDIGEEKSELPLDHYIIGLDTIKNPEFLPNVEFRHIKSLSDLTEEQREVCVYENPYTEAIEAQNTSAYWANERKLLEQYVKNNRDAPVPSDLFPIDDQPVAEPVSQPVYTQSIDAQSIDAQSIDARSVQTHTSFSATDIGEILIIGLVFAYTGALIFCNL